MKTILSILASMIMLYYAWRFVTSSKDFFSLFQKIKLNLNYLDAQEEESLCAEFQEHAYSSELKSQSEFREIEYKFFRKILLLLLRSQKIFGANIGPSLAEVRVQLEKDLDKERILREKFFSGLFQLCLFFCIIIFNIYYLETYVEDLILQESDYSDKMIIFALCLIGFGQFLLFALYFKIVLFKPFNLLFSSLYEIKIVSQLNLPLNLLVEATQGLTQNKSKHKDLKKFQSRVAKLLKLLKLSGVKVETEVQLLINELWRLYDKEVEKYEKIIKLSLFISIVFCFLPAFLILLYFISLKLTI